MSADMRIVPLPIADRIYYKMLRSVQDRYHTEYLTYRQCDLASDWIISSMELYVRARLAIIEQFNLTDERKG